MNNILTRPLFFKNGGSPEVNFGNTGGVNFGNTGGVNFGSGNIPTAGSLFADIQNSGLFDSSTAANTANTANTASNTGYAANVNQGNTSTDSGSPYGGYVPDQTLLDQANPLYTPSWLSQLQVGVPNVFVDGKQLDITPIKDDTGYTIGYNDGSGVDRVVGKGLPHSAGTLAAARGFESARDMHTKTYQRFLDAGIVDEEGNLIKGPIRGKISGAPGSMYDAYNPKNMANGGEIMQDPNMMGAPQGLDALMGQVNPQMLQGQEMEDPQAFAEAEQQAASEAEGIGRDYLNSVMTGLDNAEDAESVINALRGDQMPISSRYEELAGIVGLQDAQATPESVLALVQPTLMLSQDEGPVDSGVGRLMQGVAGDVEMATGQGDPTAMGQGVGNLMMAGSQPDPMAQPQAYAYGGEVVPIKKYAEGTEVTNDYSNPYGNVYRPADFSFSGLGDSILDFLPGVSAQNPKDGFGDYFRTDAERGKYQRDLERQAREKDDLYGNFNPIVNPEIVSTKRSDPRSVEMNPNAQGALLPENLMTNYNDTEGFEQAVKTKMDLYNRILGDPKKDNDFLKSQMFFDIAGAGLNFAAGTDAQGNRVQGSPAAQLAAAASNLPATIGARTAAARKEERDVKLLALSSAEQAEIARREVVSKERLTSVEIGAAASAVLTAEKNAVNKEVSDQDFKIAFTEAREENDYNLQIAIRNNDARNVKKLTQYNARLDKAQQLRDFGFQYKMQENRFTNQGLLMTQQAGINEDLEELRNKHDTKMDYVRSRREEKRFNVNKDIQNEQFESTQNFTKSENKLVRDAARERLDLTQKFQRGQQLNRQDLLKMNSLEKTLKAGLGDEKYSQWEATFLEDKRQFDATLFQNASEFGLDIDSHQLERDQFNLDVFKQFAELNKKEGNYSFGSGVDGATMNLFSNAERVQAYGSGKTTRQQDAEFEVAVNKYMEPTTFFNPSSGQNETRTPTLPPAVNRAIEQRIALQALEGLDAPIVPDPFNVFLNPKYDPLNNLFTDIPTNPLN